MCIRDRCRKRVLNSTRDSLFGFHWMEKNSCLTVAWEDAEEVRRLLLEEIKDRMPEPVVIAAAAIVVQRAVSRLPWSTENNFESASTSVGSGFRVLLEYISS